MPYHFTETIHIAGASQCTVRPFDAEGVPQAKGICRKAWERISRDLPDCEITIELRKRSAWTLRGSQLGEGELIGTLRRRGPTHKPDWEKPK